MSALEAGRGPAWLLWIIVSVIGGVLGALVAWRVRALLTVPAPTFVVDLLRYLATILSAAIAAGAQWFLLRRYRLDVYWWVPATVLAVLLTAIIVIPSVLRHAVDLLEAVQELGDEWKKALEEKIAAAAPPKTNPPAKEEKN